MSKELPHHSNEPLFGDEYWTDQDALFYDPTAQFASSDESPSTPYTNHTSPLQSSNSSVHPSGLDPQTSSPDSGSQGGMTAEPWFDHPTSWANHRMIPMDMTKAEPIDGHESPEAESHGEAAHLFHPHAYSQPHAFSQPQSQSQSQSQPSYSVDLYSTIYGDLQSQPGTQIYTHSPGDTAFPISSHAASASASLFSPPSYIGSAAVSKKEERKIRNRLSAQRSRQKKEEQLLDYKGKSEYFEDQCRRLQHENDRLRHENHLLRTENEKLRGSVPGSTPISASASISASAASSSSNSSPALVPPHIPPFHTDTALPIAAPNTTAVAAASRIPSFSISQLLSSTNRGALLMVVLSVGLMVNMVASPYGPSLDPKALAPANLASSSVGFRSRQILHVGDASTALPDDSLARNGGILSKDLSAAFVMSDYGALLEGADAVLHLSKDAGDSSVQAGLVASDQSLDCKDNAAELCDKSIRIVETNDERIDAL
eukprot:TRINITY_DN4746_c0_g1_i4.p1 TRINITY_DN4746_c0_g1~~TRINITY_DN4746_c0_g1_i4.p1  ORF type:complete len:486 (+),score=95.57 TRINITY_DN4746_c0_g1_i4:79-1536(+)